MHWNKFSLLGIFILQSKMFAFYRPVFNRSSGTLGQKLCGAGTLGPQQSRLASNKQQASLHEC